MAGLRARGRALDAGQKLERAERRAGVLTYVAAHPRATERQVGAALGIPKSTVHDDLAAEIKAISQRSREHYLATMIARNEQIVAAHLPLALAGKTRSADVVLAADESTAKKLGLDAAAKGVLTGQDGGPIVIEFAQRPDGPQ